MKRDPNVRFDPQYNELLQGTRKQMFGGRDTLAAAHRVSITGRATGGVRSLTGSAPVSARRPLEKPSPDASNTFLTEVETDTADQRHAAQTARASSPQQRGDEIHERKTGSQTARVRGSKSARPSITASKRRAQLNYLAIGAGDNIGDFYKPRAKNPGCSASVFPSRFFALIGSSAWASGLVT